MAMRHTQQGMTMIGWLVMMVLIGFLTLIALRLIPGYMEFYTILQSVESVHGQATPETTPAQIRGNLSKRFVVNDIESLKPSELIIKRQDGVLTIHVLYEYRTPMMGNVDAVIVFDRMVGGGAR